MELEDLQKYKKSRKKSSIIKIIYLKIILDFILNQISLGGKIIHMNNIVNILLGSFVCVYVFYSIHFQFSLMRFIFVNKED